MTTTLERSRSYITLPGTASLSDVSSSLASNGVPVIPLADACAACEGCDDDSGNGEFGDALGRYPRKFDVDRESQMMGSTKPYGRQVIISTGLSNWEHEVTEVEGSLAALIADAHRTSSGGPGGGGGGGKKEKKGNDGPSPALISTYGSGKLTVLNGSLRSVSEADDAAQTVLILPDYTFVNNVRETPEDADLLCKTRLDPKLGRAGKKDEGTSRFETRPLPYDSVILLCSHKKRDNRCGIAAGILEKAITIVLEARGWEVHTQLEIDHSIPSFEERQQNGAWASLDDAQREAQLLEEIKTSEGTHGHEGKRALIVKVSHIGGHKFAGNVIVHAPNGTGVWYGRVSPGEVPAVVDQTVIGGKIIPELLRAAVNVSKGSGHSFADW